jgi:sulfite reductase alpha subunit-like flavoprotein
VGEGVRHALLSILATHGGLSPDAAEQQLDAWQAAGRLRFDLTD